MRECAHMFLMVGIRASQFEVPPLSQKGSLSNYYRIATPSCQASSCHQSGTPPSLNPSTNDVTRRPFFCNPCSPKTAPCSPQQTLIRPSGPRRTPTKTNPRPWASWTLRAKPHTFRAKALQPQGTGTVGVPDMAPPLEAGYGDSPEIRTGFSRSPTREMTFESGGFSVNGCMFRSWS